VGGEISNICH